MTGYVVGTVRTGRLVGITMVEFVGLAGHQEMVHTCAWTTIDCGIDLRPVVYSGQSAFTRRSGVFQPGLSRDCTQSQTRILRGRSIAMLGVANMSGVPALGLPKISSLVGRIFIPTFSASPL
jgi:hypothetical protein